MLYYILQQIPVENQDKSILNALKVVTFVVYIIIRGLIPSKQSNFIYVSIYETVPGFMVKYQMVGIIDKCASTKNSDG